MSIQDTDFMLDDIHTLTLVDLDTQDELTVPMSKVSGTDMVNKPPHYVLKPGLEVIDVRTAIFEKLQREGIVVPYADMSDWDRAFEYLIRMFFKNGKEDAEKSLYYLNRLVERMRERGEYEA